MRFESLVLKQSFTTKNVTRDAPWDRIPFHSCAVAHYCNEGQRPAFGNTPAHARQAVDRGGRDRRLDFDVDTRSDIAEAWRRTEKASGEPDIQL
jgi:hypothetical protein